jgi:decaprenylphospho-beta-D-erythro-pentofuranosid-2-ulose 2-reductase
MMPQPSQNTQPTALIVGALSAMAMETARLMAARSWNLCLVARSKEKLIELSADLLARGAKKVDYIVMDVAQAADGEQLLSAAEKLSGQISTVLVAWGTLGDQAVAEKDLNTAMHILNTNFNHQALCLLGIASRFEERKSGTIVGISSVAGDRGRQSNFIYGSAKGAFSLFLQGLRNKMQKHGVHVVTVKPGFVASPMTRHVKQGPLFVGPDVVALGILKAIERKKDVVYLPWFWLPIMLIIKSIPERVFKKLSL